MKQVIYVAAVFFFTACASGGRYGERATSGSGANMSRIPASSADTDDSVSHVEGEAAKAIYNSLPGTPRQLAVGGPYVYYKFENADKDRKVFDSTSNGLPEHKGGVVCYMNDKNLEWGWPKSSPENTPEPVTYDCYTRVH